MTACCDKDARTELVDFLVHQAFYPVLMKQRVGFEKAIIKHVQNAIFKEIERFRSCASADEVVANFEHSLRSALNKGLRADLRLLNLPVLDDLRDGFEQKARDLGIVTRTKKLEGPNT